LLDQRDRLAAPPIPEVVAAAQVQMQALTIQTAVAMVVLELEPILHGLPVQLRELAVTMLAAVAVAVAQMAGLAEVAQVVLEVAEMVIKEVVLQPLQRVQ
tara:strand:- start:102 stop:401 length:300 start_codon:yes stop_codon:yes gene_type:complete